MTAIQLPFSLRTSSNVKTVHLVGNWDGYKGQLPLSKDTSKPGSWRATFRFQQATLQQGKRYWYYYIMDGYHVSHDPAKPSTKEPTTGRELNILDVPKVSGSGSTKSTSSSGQGHLRLPSQLRESRPGLGIEIPTGRGISPSRIIAPKPSKPYASRGIREADYSRSPIDELSSTFSNTRLYTSDEDDKYYPSSPASAGSSGSSLSSRSGGSSPSSLSSLSDRSASSSSSCRCNRFGITRRGEKVRLDCGGDRCGGYSDDSSECSSSEEDERVIRPRAGGAGAGLAHVQTIKPRIETIRPRAHGSAAARSGRR